MSSDGLAQNIQGNLSKDAPEMALRHHRLPFKPKDFDLTAKFNEAKESVEDMFRQACDVLEAPNSITKVASMDERVRKVRSDDGVSPLIITPSSKNRDLLLCISKTSHCLFEACHHTLATSTDIGISFHYILEVLKKLELKKKNKKQTPSFSNPFNSFLKITQKGKKKNEITKSV